MTSLLLLSFKPAVLKVWDGKPQDLFQGLMRSKLFYNNTKICLSFSLSKGYLTCNDVIALLANGMHTLVFLCFKNSQFSLFFYFETYCKL